MTFRDFSARLQAAPRPAWVLLLALLGAACSPEIGDDCVVSTDCSSTGDRLCDTSQPGGYCTIFNCEPGTCPDDSLCISFHNEASGTFCSGAVDRFQRPFCMAPCEGDGDCRGGYGCVEVGAENNPYGAVVIENGKSRARVCIANQSVLDVDAGEAPICSGEKGGVAPTPLPDAGAVLPDGSVGDASTDASSDAGADAEPADAGADVEPGDAASDT